MASGSDIPDFEEEDTAPIPRFVRSVVDELSPTQRLLADLSPPPVLRVREYSERNPLLQEIDDLVASIDELERDELLVGREELLTRHRARLEALEAELEKAARLIKPENESEIEASYQRLRAHLGLIGEGEDDAT